MQTTQTTSQNQRQKEKIGDEMITNYRRDGFVHVPGIISPEEAGGFRDAAVAAADRLKTMEYAKSIFDQCVNVWRQDDAMRGLTLHRNIAAAAEALAGVPLRLWHDQILIKQPKASKPTEFHQDQPYWPHADSTHPISCWVALCDVPVERGCMTFIPQQQHRDDLAEQDLQSDKSMFEVCPDLVWEPRVTIPLRAGDCTFHHGRTPHMATPNFTDDPRVAHVVIFVDADTTYTGKPHVVTDPLDLEPGQRLDHEVFPTATSIASGRS